MVGTVVPIVVWMTSLQPVVLAPGLWVLSTYHDVRDVWAANASAVRLWPPRPSREAALLGGGAQVAELRQMLVLPDGSLVLAQSLTVNSALFRLPVACDGRAGAPWIRSFLNHPYGLAHDGRGSLFVSNQNSNSITRYNYTTGQAIPPDTGLFASLANPRGVAVDTQRRLVYAAARDEDRVIAFDWDDGSWRVNSWVVARPIGVHLYRGKWLLLGSSGDDRVHVVDLNSGAEVAQLAHVLLVHPSGLTDVNGIVLVASQTQRLVLAWEASGPDAREWTPLGVWRKDLPLKPEGLLTLACPG